MEVKKRFLLQDLFLYKTVRVVSSAMCCSFQCRVVRVGRSCWFPLVAGVLLRGSKGVAEVFQRLRGVFQLPCMLFLVLEELGGAWQSPPLSCGCESEEVVLLHQT